MGIDDNDNVYGGVVINSSKEKVPLPLRDWYIPIQKYRYKFLSYDSYVNCVSVKTAPLSNFQTWQLLGKIEETDLQIIKTTLSTSPMETKEHLRLFNII